MLPALFETPRKMLPPPTTTATCTPSSLNRLELFGDTARNVDVDAVVLLAHQGFAGDLQQDPAVGQADLVLCRHFGQVQAQVL